MGAPRSVFEGLTVVISTTGLEDPIQGVLKQIRMEPTGSSSVGQWMYEIQLESGELMLLPVADLCYLLLKTEVTIGKLTNFKIPD